jgi:hypothetical protein
MYIYLRAYVNLRKSIISFVMSVYPSVRMEQLSCHWKDFHVILCLFFQNLSRKFNFHWNLTRITGTLHEDRYIFLSYLAQLFLEWEIFQAKFIEKIRIHILCSITDFRKSFCLWDTWKYTVEPGRSQITI